MHTEAQSNASTTQSHERIRRHYHGERGNPVIDMAMLNSWQDGFRYASSVGDRPRICAEVVRKYEARVNEYGYSLVDLSRVAVTARIRPYMLPGHELFAPSA